ncbi:MAG: NAD(P)H-hydrate dehydratase [Deltaproteobacteria bacterium]|nr:NAD(P)H-hydrate dehydratase [Deltaproteobacteria bacterium]
MKVATTEIMRSLDKKAADSFGIAGTVLMENAGRSVAAAVMREFPAQARRGVLVLCGKGNNGGDGFVAARHLINSGYHVDVVLFGKKEELTDDAEANYSALSRITGAVHELKDADGFLKTGIDLGSKGLVIDALLGTGIKGAVKEPYAGAISLINGSGLPVVSIDIPSGISADTGTVAGSAVKAVKTITFGLMKMGLVVYPGVEFAGDVEVADISIPDRLVKQTDIPYNLSDLNLIKSIVKPRKYATNKGDYGHSLIIGGSQGKSGAPILAAKAALRSGSGLVTLCGPEGLMPVFESTVIEALKEPLTETLEGFIDRTAIAQAERLLQKKTVVAIGPGIGTSEQVSEFVFEFMKLCRLPMVIDADAINIIANRPGVLLEIRNENIILTPHPGEFGRLVGMDPKEVNSDRAGIASDFAKKYRCTLVLKGARTVVANKNGEVWINPTGNPGMATGGMGDALTGIIAGLVATGIGVQDAAVAGTYIHGMAGDIVYAYHPNAAVLASDVIERIPYVISSLT